MYQQNSHKRRIGCRSLEFSSLGYFGKDRIFLPKSNDYKMQSTPHTSQSTLTWHMVLGISKKFSVKTFYRYQIFSVFFHIFETETGKLVFHISITLRSPRLCDLLTFIPVCSIFHNITPS